MSPIINQNTTLAAWEETITTNIWPQPGAHKPLSPPIHFHKRSSSRSSLREGPISHMSSTSKHISVMF